MEKNTLELKQGTESKVFQPYREVHFWSFGLLFSHPDVQHAELEKKILPLFFSFNLEGIF